MCPVGTADKRRVPRAMRAATVLYHDNEPIDNLEQDTATALYHDNKQ